MAAWCGISFMNVGANPLNQNNIWSDKGNYLYLNGEPVIDLVIPAGVTSIGNYAFTSYDKLKSVTIPQTVTSIGNWAFGGWAINIEAVYISDLTAWCNIDFEGGCNSTNPLYIANNLYLNGELITELVIPDGITAIKNNAFAGGNFNSIIIPEGVTSIGEYAFENCTNITSVKIPNSVTFIGEHAFRDCKNLTGVRLPDGITEIHRYTFAMCYELKDIIIPSSVTLIERGAFYSAGLEKLFFCGTAEQWADVTIELSSNNLLATAGIYFYSEKYPYDEEIVEGNFWRYVDGEIVVWTKEII